MSDGTEGKRFYSQHELACMLSKEMEKLKERESKNNQSKINAIFSWIRKIMEKC